MAFSSAVRIDELDTNRNVLRSVELRGPALPKQGASWDSDMNMTTDWYPGNADEATQQILGPREMPSQWEGVWRLTMMIKTPSTFSDVGGSFVYVTSPQFLRDTLDDIFRAGRRLRVTWITDASGDFANAIQGKIVREGRCKQWKFPHTRTTDIEWNFEFHWLSRGPVTNKVVSVRDSNVPSATASLTAAIAATLALVNSRILLSNKDVTNSATRFTLGQLETLANAPVKLVKGLTKNLQQITSDFNQVAGIINTLRNVPFQMANTAIDFGRNTVAIANQFIDVMSRTPVELLATKSKASDLGRSLKYFGQVTDSSALTARTARDLEDKIRATRSTSQGLAGASVRDTSATRAGDLIAVHIVKQGDTPDSISIKYYSSPDHAIDILRANRLPWGTITLKPGSVLIIPVLSTIKGV